MLICAKYALYAGCWVGARGELAGFNNTIVCTLRAAIRQPASAGCWVGARGELAGFDNTIVCPLRVAIRQPASAGCWVGAPGELACFDNTIVYTRRAAARQPALAGCRALDCLRLLHIFCCTPLTTTQRSTPHHSQHSTHHPSPDWAQPWDGRASGCQPAPLCSAAIPPPRPLPSGHTTHPHPPRPLTTASFTPCFPPLWGTHLQPCWAAPTLLRP